MSGIEELVGLQAASAAAGVTAEGVLGGAAETALLADAGIATGTTLPAAAAASSLPSLSTIGTVASVGGTLLSAGAQADEARYQLALAKNQAAALRMKANEDAAAAERQQIAQERKMGLVLSRARAVGAASGTDATSPDLVTNEMRIAQQGEYNALSSLYEGLSSARADEYEANIDLFRGRRYAATAPLAIGGTLLSGLTNFADRRARLNYFSSNPSSFFGAA